MLKPFIKPSGNFSIRDSKREAPNKEPKIPLEIRSKVVLNSLFLARPSKASEIISRLTIDWLDSDLIDWLDSDFKAGSLSA
jgi:hypothetical protein